MKPTLMMTLVVLLATTLSAQAQERIRFQGRLTTPGGAAITTATDVVFRMYATPTGGTAQWTESHSGGSAITPSASGVFTVELGAITAITGVDFGQPVYVGVTFSTDGEMTPRYLLTSAAHAHHAKDAAALGGLARTGFAELTGATFTGQVTATQFIGSGAGLTSIPAGQLTGTLAALDGSALTNVNAATLGGLARAGFAELSGATFTGQLTATQFNGSGAGLTSIPAGQLTGILPALDGSALTMLNASNLASGTVPSARLSGTYSEVLTFSNITSATIGSLTVNGTATLAELILTGGVKLGTVTAAAAASNEGTLRWDSTGKKVEVSDGTAWTGVGGAPTGTIIFSSDPTSIALQSQGFSRDPEFDSQIRMGVTTHNAPTGRHSHTSVWTGSSMIVWGGQDNAGPRDDGRQYSPQSDHWTVVNPSGAPAARYSHSAVWTGTRMLVWGGQAGASWYADGGSYDGSSWSVITATGAPTSRIEHVAVWTGTRMVVWGGWDGSNNRGDGGSYDPIANTWTALSTSGAPSARRGHTGVWTGSRLLIWGGTDSGFTSSGGIYDPISDSWSPMASSPLMARSGHSAIWTGSRMIIWGGWSGGIWHNNGAAYDPIANSWNSVSTVGAPSGRSGHSAVWTGTKMIVWGGGLPGAAVDTGGIYDPVADSWAPSTIAGAPSPRHLHTTVWTGDRAIIWGGEGWVQAGGRFSPSTDSWDRSWLFAYRAP